MKYLFLVVRYSHILLYFCIYCTFWQHWCSSWVQKMMENIQRN